MHCSVCWASSGGCAVLGSLIGGNVGLNLAEGMDVHIWCLLCIV